MSRVALSALLVAGLAACTQGSPASKDNSNLEFNTDKRLVYTNAEDYKNVVAFCDGKARIYVTTSYRPIVVPNSTECGGTGTSPAIEQGDGK